MQALPSDCSSLNCFSMGPPWGCKSCQQSCSSVGFLGGSQSPSPSAPARGSPLAAGDLCCWTPWAAGVLLPHHGLYYRLQRNICSGAWNIFCPPFSTGLDVFRVVSLTFSHSSLHLQLLLPSCSAPPSPFLFRCIIPEALPLLLMGSTLASGSSILEPAGAGSIEHRGTIYHLLTGAASVAPPLAKPCHANPTQWYGFIW